MKKLNQKGFGPIEAIILIVVFILVSVVIGYVSTRYKAGVKEWLTTNQIQSKTEAIKQNATSASNAAIQNNTALMQSACEQLSSDVKTAQQIPAGPDAKLYQQLTESLTTLANGAQDCTKAIETGDNSLLTSSGQETTKGLNQLATFVNSAKGYLN